MLEGIEDGQATLGAATVGAEAAQVIGASAAVDGRSDDGVGKSWPILARGGLGWACHDRFMVRLVKRVGTLLGAAWASSTILRSAL